MVEASLGRLVVVMMTRRSNPKLLVDFKVRDLLSGSVLLRVKDSSWNDFKKKLDLLRLKLR